MKFFPAQFTFFLRNRVSQRNLKAIFRFLLVLVVVVNIYSVAFHYLMAWEGREFSWVTGYYWTLTVMSTLGFGDITFTSDIGRLFSMFVLLSGMIFLLILLPFTFIQFFYAPWMEAQAAARAPRQLSDETKGHVILTRYGPVTSVLISKLQRYDYPYVVVVPDLQEALRLYDLGIKVMVGDLDDPETYERARVRQAALVATTQSDAVNSNVAFTVREISEHVPIIATAQEPASVDILQLAGANHVLQLAEMMGQFLARRTIGGDAMTHTIGQFDDLLVAEATVAGTPLVGKMLGESKLRETVGITVVGIWERGEFANPQPHMKLTAGTVLLLAGTEDQLNKYDELFAIYHVASAPVIIIGGGRVGRATGKALKERKIDYRIVERLADRVRDAEKYVVGDAAQLDVLHRAGIMESPTVIITTHDDDTNIYLTIYFRRLRPDIQIISRSTLDRNVPTLHRAGADFVMSYASMGANAIFNLLKRSDVLMVAEGLNVLKMKVPAALAGKSLAETSIRSETGCSVIAVSSNGTTKVNPDPQVPLPEDGEIVIIGTVESENVFIETYGDR